MIYIKSLNILLSYSHVIQYQQDAGDDPRAQDNTRFQLPDVREAVPWRVAFAPATFLYWDAVVLLMR